MSIALRGPAGLGPTVLHSPGLSGPSADAHPDFRPCVLDRMTSETDGVKVFLRYYVELPFAMQQIDEVIGRVPGEWLDAAAREANIRGLLLSDPVKPPYAQPDAPHLCVVLSAGEYHPGLIRRPLQWLEVLGDACEPVVRGDLELAELGPARTQLALSGQYRPFFTASESTDRLAVQRVGESTLKSFVDRLALYLATILGAAASEPSGPPAAWPAPAESARNALRMTARSIAS
jgi:hypothetical protein